MSGSSEQRCLVTGKRRRRQYYTGKSVRYFSGAAPRPMTGPQLTGRVEILDH
jgi:hypothetical protein